MISDQEVEKLFIDPVFSKFILPEDTREALEHCGWRIYPETKEQLTELCFGPTHTSRYDVTYTIPGGEDGHGRLTFTFKTEGGYVGVFGTLSIEVAPMTLIEVDAESGATTLSFFPPKADE